MSRTVLITGATSGHGLGLARLLARRGDEVILLGRNPERCLAAGREVAEAGGGRQPRIVLCDLASQREIDRAADEVIGAGVPLRGLVNNAGIVNQTRQVTADGAEMVFAVNYLAQFQLTLRLLPLLAKNAPARVVNVSSEMYRMGSLPLGDLAHHKGYSWWSSYGRSKLAILYFTRELARRLEGSGVTCTALDPGPVASRIAQQNPGFVPRVAGYFIQRLFPSPDHAARMAADLVASPAYATENGGYFRLGKRLRPRLDRNDPDRIARELWRISARITGIDLSRTGV